MKGIACNSNGGAYRSNRTARRGNGKAHSSNGASCSHNGKERSSNGAVSSHNGKARSSNGAVSSSSGAVSSSSGTAWCSAKRCNSDQDQTVVHSRRTSSPLWPIARYQANPVLVASEGVYFESREKSDLRCHQSRFMSTRP